MTSSAAPAGATYPGRNGLIAFEGWGACVPGPGCVSPTNPTYDIWTVRPDGTGLTNITNSVGVDADAAWSPDGTQIVFNSNRHGDYDLFVMNPDGSELTRLTQGLGNEIYPTWSPNGRRIAYMDFSRRTFDIVIMRRDGSKKRRIASFEYAYGLQWSPDGKRLAFVQWDQPDGREDVYLIRPDGSGLRRLYKGRLEGSLPSWSPDGKKLTFAGSMACTTCDYDIWVVRRDGTRLRKVVEDDLWQTDPAWSPDGRHIVYTNERDDEVYGYGDLWVVNVDGSNNRRLLSKPDSYDYAIDWQPLPK